MIRHRTEEEVRRYDLLKLGVLLLLLALLALTWFATRDLRSAELAGGDLAPPAGEATASPDGVIAGPGEDVTLPGGDESGEAQEPLPAPTLAAPSIDSPGGALAAGSVTLSGMAGPGAQVAILANDQTVGAATAGVDGAWSATVDLPPGEYAIRAQTVDNVGGIVGESQPVTITVGDGTQAGAGEQSPPVLSPPVEVLIDAASGEATLPIAPGPITWSGQGQPGTQVEMLIDGLRVGLAAVDPTGAWSLPVNMPAGDYTLQLNSLDEAGDVLSSSEPLRVVVGDSPATGETGTPDNSAVSIADALAGQPGEFSVLLSLLDSSGLGESLPGSGPFTLFAPTDEAFGLLPQRFVDGLAANPENLSRLLQNHIAGGVQLAADLLATPPTMLSGHTPAFAPQGDTLSVDGATVLSADSTAAGGVIHAIDRVLLPPLAEGIQPPAIDGSGAATFAGTALTIVGTAAPGRTILVEMNGEPFGQPATVNVDGTWLVSGEVTPGDYQIFAYMLDAADWLEGISQPVALQVSAQ